MMDAPTISRPVLGFFRHIVRGYFRRHFRAVRVLRAERFTACAGSPLIVYANHGSWWDPMVSVLLAAQLMPGRPHYAPMDADALERYPILKRIGIFGVESATARGAAHFLRTGLAALRTGGAVWVTPQGRFADARERPLHFKPGLARLALRAGEGCRVLPLAIEYTFWNERLPEALLAFGESVSIAGQSAEELEEQLLDALQATMDDLAAHAIARDPAPFSVLSDGRAGTGGFYALRQRLASVLGRRAYQPDHTARAGSHGRGA